MPLFHASCVEFEEYGLLICGDSGSGKSDLCLRLLNSGARLVADDQTEIKNDNGRLIARCPENLRNMLEVRGIGIVETPSIPQTEIRLKLILQNKEKIDRMPSFQTEEIEGVPLPVFRMNAFENSAVLKIKTFIAILKGERKIVT